MLKGQTQAVSAVLITAVMIGAITSAYVWGTPLLEKRESQAEVNQLENDIISLREDAEFVSEAGKLTASETNLRVEDGSVEVNTGNDNITVRKEADTSKYPNGTSILLSGQGMPDNSVGVLGLHSRTAALASIDNEGNAVYVLEFRDLKVSSGGQKRFENLSLSGSGTSQGETLVVLENKGSSRVGNDIVTNIEVRLR